MKIHNMSRCTPIWTTRRIDLNKSIPHAMIIAVVIRRELCSRLPPPEILFSEKKTLPYNDHALLRIQGEHIMITL